MKITAFGENRILTGVLRAIFSALLLLLAWNASANEIERGGPGSKRKYNVVLVTVNGLRYKHLGGSGYSRPTTPAMDRLAEKSFVFTNAFAQNGYTMPNMMTMFTSLYPESHDVMDAYKDGLSSRVRTLAEIFRENGYRTAGFWRKDLAHLDLRAGFGRGFGLVVDLEGNFSGLGELFTWLTGKREEPFFLFVNTRNTHFPYFPFSRQKSVFREGKRGNIPEDEEDYDRGLYRKVVEAIRTPGSGLYGTIDVDAMERNADLFDGIYQNEKIKKIAEMIPPVERYRLGQLRTRAYYERLDLDDPDNLKFLVGLYDACVLGADQELVKPILESLEELGIADRTIVVITAEHGVGLGEHGILSPGTLYYEDLIHVPLIIKVPGSPVRKELNDLVQTVDLMPTILELSGIPVPAQAQGKSLVPRMEGRPGKPPNDAVMGSNRMYAFIRTGEWKLIVWREHLDLPLSDRDELFHLTEDPEEMVNLLATQGGMYGHLRGRILERLRSMPRYVDTIAAYPESVDDTTRKRIRETGYW